MYCRYAKLAMKAKNRSRFRSVVNKIWNVSATFNTEQTLGGVVDQ